MCLKVLYVVDEPSLVSDALHLLLNTHTHFIVRRCGIGEVVWATAALKADVLLLSAHSGRKAVAALVREVIECASGPPLVVLRTRPTWSEENALRAAGAAAVVGTEASFTHLLRTFGDVTASPSAHTSQVVVGAICRNPRTPNEKGEPTHRALTAREYEVEQLIAQGLSNKAIGRQLSIATHTVRAHIRHIMSKIGVRTRVQIAVHTLTCER